MFARILKKDLQRKKGITIIVFLFMIMATLFISVSANNIFEVLNATNYSLEMGKVSDIYISAFEQKDGRKIEDWLENNELVTDYTVNKGICIEGNNIESFNGGAGDEYHLSGNIIIAQTVWTDFMPLYDSKGNLAEVEPGELAMSEKAMEKNNVKVGDTLTLRFEDYVQTFTIVSPIQDPACGSDFCGITKYLFNEKDYAEIEQNSRYVMLNYGVNTKDNIAFLKAFNKQGYDTIVIIEKDMFRMMYIMSLIVAVVLIIIGICLIVISFLVLRFTIVFTIEEEYKEIGVMKAIGIKDIRIRMLYLTKYFALITLAAVIGCAISIPVSSYSLDMVVAGSMMLPDRESSMVINLISAVVVTIMVMLLCLFSTRKIKKFSAIEAVRSGATGERYTGKRMLRLKKAKYIRPTFFMAFNDIVSELKKYVVLMLTFSMGTLLIILALNTITSLTSDEMAENFCIDTETDFFLNQNEVLNSEIISMYDSDAIDKVINRTREMIQSAGYDADVSLLTFRTISYYKKDSDDILSYMTGQCVGNDGSHIDIAVGETPLLENEMAMSVQMMKALDVQVGDTICAKIGAEEKEFVITGKYANYMQLGKSALMSSTVDLSPVTLAGMYVIEVKLKGVSDSNRAKAIREIETKLPDYELMTAQDVVASQMGSEMGKFNDLKILILFLVCGINVLITVLMVKIFIISEKGQIAMLRAIGFSNSQLKLWQMFRIGIILFIANVLGILCSVPGNHLLLKPVFAMMGAEYMTIHIDYREAYCIYPLVLLIITCTSAFVSAAKLKKLKIMEINNME